MAIGRANLPRLRRLPLALATLLAAASLAAPVALGCSTTPAPVLPEPCDVQVVTLTMFATDTLNPNENGNPRPVVVRLYQLKSDVRLLNATYDDVLLRDKEILADDVMKVDEVNVFPNDRVEVKFERIKDASYLAGVALFHSPTGSSWKTFYEFPLLPGQGACGAAGEGGGEGAPEAEPKVAFFLDGAKIDNGSQFDESMFTASTEIRRISLPKKSAAPEAAAPVAP